MIQVIARHLNGWTKKKTKTRKYILCVINLLKNECNLLCIMNQSVQQ
jgi:hypothetical protein